MLAGVLVACDDATPTAEALCARAAACEDMDLLVSNDACVQQIKKRLIETSPDCSTCVLSIPCSGMARVASGQVTLGQILSLLPVVREQEHLPPGPPAPAHLRAGHAAGRVGERLGVRERDAALELGAARERSAERERGPEGGSFFPARRAPVSAPMSRRVSLRDAGSMGCSSRVLRALTAPYERQPRSDPAS